MRVYISVDMEGIGGISHPDPTDPKDVRYPTSVALMIGETNAAIEGALAGGATDILVNDSHWNMTNLLPAEVHPAARLLQGGKAWSMVAGAQPGADGRPGFDVALFVGYHARAGHPTGTIAHTYSDAPVETRLAGRPTGEYGLNALVLGRLGHPRRAGHAVTMPSRRRSSRGCPGRSASSSRPPTRRRVRRRPHPGVACDRVRAGAERAVSRVVTGAGTRSRRWTSADRS